MVENSNIKKVIGRFTDEYFFLSNFYPAPTTYDGVTYSTSEHAYQAAKTMIHSERREIKRCKFPGEAKRLGQRVTLRYDFEKIKLDLMLEVLRDKFSDKTLADKLLATEYAELVEYNDWQDVFWGKDKKSGKGKNHLGKLLMQVREELKERTNLS